MQTVLTETEPRRRGPKPRVGETYRTNILIEPELLDWAKEQPGGLSDLVRRLVRQEKERQEREGAAA